MRRAFLLALAFSCLNPLTAQTQPAVAGKDAASAKQAEGKL